MKGNDSCLTAAMILVAIAGCQPVPPSLGPPPHPQYALAQLVGQPVPNFSGTLASGAVVSAESLRGTIAVLDFVAPNCGFSKKQLPRLETIRKRYAEGVRILAVVETMGPRFSEADKRTAISQSGFHGETLSDSENTIGRTFGVFGFPTTIVLARNSTVSGTIVGNTLDYEREVTTAIERALRGDAPETDLIVGPSKTQAIVRPSAPVCDVSKLDPKTDPQSLAVMDFDVSDAEPSLGRTVADFARRVVLESKQFILVDRQNIVKVLGEEDFTNSIRCDDTKCLVNYGRKLRAQKMMHGRIAKIGDTYTLTISATDVATARIEGIQAVKMEGSVDKLLDVISPVTCELIRDIVGR